MYTGGAKQQTEPKNLIESLTQQLGLDEEEEASCWPENWQTLLIFDAMGTQWLANGGVVVGLRYEAIAIVLDAFGVEKKARGEMFHLLRIMEYEALQVMNKRDD